MKSLSLHQHEIMALTRLLGHHTLAGGDLARVFNRLVVLNDGQYGQPFNKPEEARINREMYGDRPMLIIE